MAKKAITTSAAPAAIGTYSQAIQSGGTLYLSGQIPLDPATGELVVGDIHAQIHQVFRNLGRRGRCGPPQPEGCGQGERLPDRLAKLRSGERGHGDNTFPLPFPARAAIGVASLPRGAAVEADAILTM